MHDESPIEGRDHEKCTEVLGAVSSRYVTLAERLKRERSTAQAKVDDLNAAIKALEENPQFENMLNVLGKVTRI